MTIDIIHSRFTLLLAGVSLLAAYGCDQAPLDVKDQPQDMADPNQDLLDCSSEALLAGRIVASEKFVRSAGKPATDLLPFTLGEGEGLCVVIATGTVSPTGEVLEPPPASMTLGLDGSVELASPNDFNAKPQLLVRAAPAVDSLPGDHTLAVELRGKSGPDPAVAVVTVVAVPSAAPSSSMSPVAIERFEDPKRYATVVKDEAIVVFAESPTEAELAGTLALLPFPAVPVGRLAGVPSYQVYLPGATGGEDLRARVDAIGGLPGIAHAGLHHVGGVVSMILPAPGTDVDYVGDGKLLPAGWHLRDIKAQAAWTAANTTSAAHMGVVDNGFRIYHPDLVGNIVQWLLPTGDVEMKFSNANLMAPQETSEMCLRDPEKCNDWKACFPSLPRDHGTAVAALMAAEGENKFADDDANGVGVVWHGGLHVGSYSYDTPPPEKSSGVYSSFGAQRIVAAMAQAGVRVVNMSFGDGAFCWNGEVFPDYRTMELAAVEAAVDRRTADEAAQWGLLLSNHKRLMIVSAAGNRGTFCDKGNWKNKPAQWAEIPGDLCESRASGHGCAVQGEEAKQVLCVGAADPSGDVSATSSPAGDRLVAPGMGMHITPYEGGLLNFNLDEGGTSLSAPLVTGAVSLLQGMNMEMNPRVLHDIIKTGGSRYRDYKGGRYRNLDLLAASQQVARCRVKYTNFAAGAEGCPQFSDVPKNAWYYSGVHRLACNCVLQGYDDGTFLPGGAINRAEALKVVLLLAFPYEAFPAPKVAPYDDVPADAWFAGYVEFAKSKKLIGPGFLVAGTALAPGEPLTRGEFARLLVESAKLSAVEELQDLAKAAAQKAAPKVVYTDIPANYPHRDHIYAAANQCVVEGQAGGTKFAPLATLNRAEASKAGCLAIYGFGGLQCGEVDGTCAPIVP